MLVAQIAMGVLALVCALIAAVVLFKAKTDQRAVVISMTVLAVIFVVLMVWAGFIPQEETVVP